MSTDLWKKIAAMVLTGAGAFDIAWVMGSWFEGYSTKAYLDPVGIPTICAGITKGVKLGQTKTDAECDALREQEVRAALAIVDQCVKVPLNDYQLAAFVDFAYNVGPGKKGVKDGFCTLKSGEKPSFLKKLNAHDYKGACDGLLEWASARGRALGGRTLPGLVKRREAERELCLAS